MTTPPLVSMTETVGAASSIKDAYCEWLRDVDALTRKRKGKKKSKRLVALRHLAQPTESSAKKRFQAPAVETGRAANAVSSDEAAEARLDAQRRRFQSLADEASYAHFTYERPWGPGLAFFAFIATQAESRAVSGLGHHGASQSASLRVTRREILNFPVRVPPTVLRRQRPSQGIVVFFTIDTQREPEEDAFCNIARRYVAETATDWTLQFHYFSTRDGFESRLPWVLRMLTSVGNDVKTSTMAVLKTATARGNHVQALDSLEATEAAVRSLWADEESFPDGGTMAVQTHVASKGTTGSSGGKAWIARPAYRKKDQSAATVWILTGTDPLFATTAWDSNPNTTTLPCQIVKCTTAQSWQAPRVLVETLCQCLDVQVLRPSSVGTLAELVVDLVQDTQGMWWLLQVKAFQLRRSHLPPSVRSGTSRARSAPDHLETLSVASLSSKASGFLATKTKWKCAGKYCHYDDCDDGAFSTSENQAEEPSGFLTKKEVLSCEFFDRVHASDDASLSGGCTNFASALRFYVQHQLTKRERTVLYEPQALCGACIQRYYALRTGMTLLTETEGGHDRKNAVPLRGIKRAALSTSRSLAALVPIAAHATKLPALYLASELRASQSMPEIPSGVSSVTPPPSYMDELERIEKLLADDKQQLHYPHQPQPQHLLSTTIDNEDISTLQPLAPIVEPATVTTKATFSWQDATHRANRVDEMWQSIHLKPLAHPSEAYNTFSLQAALNESTIQSTPRGDQRRRQMNGTNPHLISLVDCRRVFSDEAFRESFVRETIDRLLTHRQAVRFVVMPADDQDHTDLSLGRMALRTLALDIDQSLVQEGISVARGLPSIAANSGCLFMTVPVP